MKPKNPNVSSKMTHQPPPPVRPITYDLYFTNNLEPELKTRSFILVLQELWFSQERPTSLLCKVHIIKFDRLS